MTVSQEKKFVWFQVPKVGTRTIINHFRKSEVPMTMEEGFKIYYCARRYSGFFKFGFVRNPWDRLVSCWLNRVLDQNYFKFDPALLEKMKRFDNFVEFVSGFDLESCNRHFRLQRNLIDLRHLDFLGRAESFKANFEKVCRYLDVPCEMITPQNVSSGRKSYQEYYTPDLRDRVFQLYRKDIQIFGYEFGQPGRVESQADS